MTIKQDGSDYLITFTLSSGNGYIKSMTLNGEQPTATTANGDTWDLHLQGRAPLSSAKRECRPGLCLADPAGRDER
ncbi:hypothetical protein ACW180_09445, partial [Limosilactobacillus fermentum]